MLNKKTINNRNKKNLLLRYICTWFICMTLLSWCWNSSHIWEVNSPEIPNGTATKSNIQKIILTLGDSLTAWYNLDISESYPSQLHQKLINNWYNYKVINAGVSGDTSKNLLDRIELYNDIPADIYILAIGWNDWLRKLSTIELQKNIESIIHHLQNVNPDGKIILAWMQIPLNAWLEYAQEFSQLYRDIQENDPTINLFPFLLEWVATKKELNLSDSIHPNKQWYNIIAQNIFNFIDKNHLITK